MMGKLGITILPKVPKLIQSLQEKSGYALLYLTLQLYIKFGVKVTHIHRVLQFRQCKWMASFAQMNNELRKKARNIFEENFYKLMINSSFGKTMESKQNRTKMSIVRNKTELKPSAKVVPELIDVIPIFTRRPCYNNIQSELNPVG